MYYHISDFQNILFNKIEYQLPDNVLNAFKLIEASLDVNDTPTNGNSGQSQYSNLKGNNPYKTNKNMLSYSKTSNINDKRKQNTNKKEIKHEEWEAVRNFKATKISVKTGIDKVWADIRTTLNKMSSATFQKISEQVYVLIDEYMLNKEECNEDNTIMIATNILNSCCGNSFYSELFADFYCQLCSKYEVFASFVLPFVDETFDQIILDYVDSDIDYDGYCKYNKLIVARKAKNSFIVNLMKRNLVSVEKVLDMVKWYLETIMTNVIKDGRAYEVGELTENLHILVSNNTPLFTKYSAWNEEIYPSIETLGKSSNSKTFPSMSNRVIFKFMDILDSL